MMDLKSTDTPFNGGASTTLAACYRHARCQAFVAAMRRERRQKAAARPHCARACTRAACWLAHASHAAAHSGAAAAAREGRVRRQTPQGLARGGTQRNTDRM